MTCSTEVRCRVRRGLFSNEYVVMIETLRDDRRETREFVADSRGVLVDVDPGEGEIVPGKTLVYLIDREASRARVLVPASGGSDASYIYVPIELLA